MVVQRNGSLYVQQATLKKLICTRCKKFLSYPPIYRHVSQGPVCGRCISDNIENFFRDELYEQAIELQKFPCIYYEKGCLENLFPHQVPEHEKNCIYMELNCPSRVYSNCIWQGSVDKLLEHFEKEHPAFILRDCRFEVDFVNNHKENYIMPFGEDIYVVTREANSNENSYAVTVSCPGTHNGSKYIYVLTLESGNRNYKHSISQELGERLELQGQIVKDMLHDPVTIIANISIQEAPADKKTGDSKNEKEDSDNSDIDYNQLSELECPVCFNYMVPPIFQCERGHSICSDCKSDQKVCPTCRGAINNTQNYVLEKVISNMIYPCKHTGCKFTTKAKNIKQHEASCLFGPFTCPLKDYENCTQIFPISDLFNHIKNNHYESLVELDTISIPIDNSTEEDINEGYIIRYSNQIFKLCFKYDHEHCEFYWAIQFVGPPEESTKYQYELEIIDNHGKNNRLYVKTNCSPLASMNESLENEDYFIYFSKDQIWKFIKYQLTYRIRIIA